MKKLCVFVLAVMRLFVTIPGVSESAVASEFVHPKTTISQPRYMPKLSHARTSISETTSGNQAIFREWRGMYSDIMDSYNGDKDTWYTPKMSQAPSGLGAQADVNVELVGQWGGDCDAVAISDNLAYIGLGPSLVILDISEPSNPVKLGKIILPDMVSDIAVVGEYAYVSDSGAGLQIIDVSDPTSPGLICDTDIYVRRVVIVGSFAYMVGQGLHIFDITDPANPVQVGWYDTPAMGVAIADNRAYIAGWGTGLQIIDVSDSSNPLWLGSCATTGLASEIAVSGDYAYIINGDMDIIDISDPANPFLVNTYEADYLLRNRIIANEYVYVIDTSRGFQILDVSDHSNPIKIGSYKIYGIEGLVLDGDNAYLGNGRGLHIVDVNVPENPTLLGRYESNGSISCVGVADNYVYTGGWYGIRVIDVNDPANPELVGLLETPGLDLLEIEIADSYAYAACQFGGLHIINISNPASPAEVSIYPGIIAGDIDVAGNYAYVTARSEGLHILDVSNPSLPVHAVTIEGYASKVSVKGNYLYVTGDGLKIYDVSDLTSPQLVGSNEDLGGDIFIYGDYAYLSTGYGTLVTIVNISNPSSPIVVYDYPTWECAWDTFVVDNRAYIADGNPGIQIVDVSDPANPIQVGAYDTVYANDVVVSGDYIYVADAWGGLAILTLSTNQPPVACITGGGQVVEAQGPWGATVGLDGSCSEDADSTAGTNDDIAYFDWYEVEPGDDVLLGTGESIDYDLPLGEHTIMLEITDKAGALDSTEVTIVVQDTTAPTIDCPQDITLEATGPTGAVAAFEVTATDICDPAPEVICGPPSGTVFGLGTTEVTCTATDNSGNSAGCSFTVTVVDTTPPTIDCPGDITLEATSPAGAVATFTAIATDVCDTDPQITFSMPPGSTFGLGETKVVCTATDNSGNGASCSFIVTVGDTLPPDFQLSVTPSVLWPPNHKMVRITPSWTVSDICDESPDVSLVSISSSESNNGKGDGHTNSDIRVDEDGSIYLRAERSGKGAGRVYSIIYQAVDNSGNSTQQSAIVTVPHNAPLPRMRIRRFGRVGDKLRSWLFRRARRFR